MDAGAGTDGGLEDASGPDAESGSCSAESGCDAATSCVADGSNCEPALCSNDPDDHDKDWVAPCDNCPGVANSSQVDIDNDGVGWACDYVTRLPRALTQPAHMFQGSIASGEVVSVGYSLYSAPDTIAVMYGADKGNSVPIVGFQGNAAQATLLVASGTFGLATKGYPTGNYNDYQVIDMTYDGSLFLGGQLLGTAVVGGKLVMPFGEAVRDLYVYDFGRANLVKVVTPQQTAIYLWEKGSAKKLLDGYAKIEVWSEGVPQIAYLVATDQFGRHLLVYNAATGEVTDTQVVAPEVYLLGWTREGAYWCISDGPASPVSLMSFNAAFRWQLRSVAGSAGCDRTSKIVDSKGVFWFSYRACDTCLWSHAEENVVRGRELSSQSIQKVRYLGGTAFVDVGERMLVRRATGGDLSWLTSTGSYWYAVAEQPDPSGQWIFASSRPHETGGADVLIAVAGVNDVREYSFAVPSEHPGVTKAAVATNGVWLGVSTDQQTQLWYLDAASKSATLKLAANESGLGFTPRGDDSLVSAEGKLYAFGAAGELRPVQTDASGADLSETWSLAKYHSDVVTGADGYAIVELTRANGRRTVAAWKSGALVTPASSQPAVPSELNEIESVQQGWKAEDGTAWIAVSVAGETWLLSYAGGNPTVQWRGHVEPYSLSVGDSQESALSMRPSAPGVIGTVQGSEGVRVWRFRGASLEDLVRPDEWVTLEGGYSGMVTLTGKSGRKRSCSWPMVAKWQEPGACVEWGVDGGTLLAETRYESNRDVAAALVSDGIDDYLVRLPLK